MLLIFIAPLIPVVTILQAALNDIEERLEALGDE
jgi:hypothetical protein